MPNNQSAGAVLLAIVLATASQQSGPTLALGLGAACAVAAGLFSLSRRSGIRAAAGG